MHKVMLTFDDGPVPEDTPRILDSLAKADVKAAFFVVGDKLLGSVGALEIVRRAASEGHLIGNHSFSHPDLTRLSSEDVRSEILRTHDLISEFEPKQKLFRPPYGSYNETVDRVVRELRYEPIWWNADSGDWKPENQSSAWVDAALEQILMRRRAICLCHDTSHTADHLDLFLGKIKTLPKYEFVRYDHCRTLRRRTKLLGYRLLDTLLARGVPA